MAKRNPKIRFVLFLLIFIVAIQSLADEMPHHTLHSSVYTEVNRLIKAEAKESDVEDSLTGCKVWWEKIPELLVARNAFWSWVDVYGHSNQYFVSELGTSQYGSFAGYFVSISKETNSYDIVRYKNGELKHLNRSLDGAKAERVRKFFKFVEKSDLSSQVDGSMRNKSEVDYCLISSYFSNSSNKVHISSSSQLLGVEDKNLTEFYKLFGAWDWGVHKQFNLIYNEFLDANRGGWGFN